MTETLQFSAIVDGVQMKKDSTISLRLGTQELPADEMAKIFRFANMQIWCAFKEIALTEKDIEVPDFIPEFDGQKSHSQRLHGVIWRLWEQSDKKKTARAYYEDIMEKLINAYKEKLN